MNKPRCEGRQAFRAGAEVQIGQVSSEHQVYLVDVTDVIEPIRNQPADGGPGLLKGLPPGAFCDGFSVFQLTGRQGPFAIARFDGPPAKEDFALPLGDAADHNPGILVVDRAAGSARVARTIISGQYLQGNGCATSAAKLHSSYPLTLNRPVGNGVSSDSKKYNRHLHCRPWSCRCCRGPPAE